MIKNFLVFAMSENSNSFGLKQFYAMAEDGQTFHACANSLNVPEKGNVLNLTMSGEFFRSIVNPGGYELLTYLVEDAPQDVIDDVYGTV